MITSAIEVNPELDLVLERVIDVPLALVWTAWTKPEHVSKWFAPKPWTVASCEMDLRPGGAFRFVMRSPEGQEFPNVGCYLEVVPQSKLVWTDALLPGYRPAPEPFFTAVVSMQTEGKGTRYRAIAVHKDAVSREKHEQMGFFEGWGQVLDQLVTYAKNL